MTKNTAVLKQRNFLAKKGELVRKNWLWALGGLALQLGAGGSASPAAHALFAGTSGARALAALLGGILGALLHGFPSALFELSALGIVLAGKVIPDFNSIKIRGFLRFTIAAIACFFSRAGNALNAFDLLFIIISSLSAGIFALCVCLLEHLCETRGFDISDARDCTLLSVIITLSFMTLGRLDYSFINIGRLLAGYLVLYQTSRRGLLWCGITGISALFGLCAASPEAGAAGAAMIFAAAASASFSRFGKLSRAAAFAFITAAGVLITGADEGKSRIIIEACIAAGVFVLVPVPKSVSRGFSDATAALIIKERLNFAADAIAGISSGLNAAAEALDKKYAKTLGEISERAADKVCRHCPNSMNCWGKDYELFEREFSRLVTQLRTGFELTEYSLSAECAEKCVDPAGVAKALSREYARFVSAMNDERRIRELRRIYTDQLEGTREILREMSRAGIIVKAPEKTRSAELKAEKVLKENGVEFPQAFVTFDGKGRLFFEAYGATEPNVDKEYLGVLLGKALGRELCLPEISGGGANFRVTAAEAPPLSAKIGAYQLAKGQNNVCGDCFESFFDASGALYVILSDGMGTGSRARVDSAMACSVLSKLIKSGIPLPAALETVNTALMVKSADESFATLDICRIDLSGGECAVYKAGAATTYIKKSDKLLRASLASPPAGTGGKLVIPAQRFSVSSGDVIIMTTDGAVIDEQWLSRELSAPFEPEELSERIAKAARQAENGKRDDISVIAVAVN